MRWSLVSACTAACTILAASQASAQPLGTFRFQMQPYCNVVSFSVTQVGGLYRLEGTDDQCGAPTLAAATGLAFLNPNGTIGFGFTIVASPGAGPVMVDANILVSTLSGTWRDSSGNTGSFTFTPGAGTGGASRPVGSGVISTVIAGAGLTGGAAAGDATLAVAFAGSGAATTVARSDHTHAQVQFRVEGQQSQPLPSGVRTDLQWNTVAYNDGGGSYSAASGVYTVPVTGLYIVTTSGATNNVASPSAATFRFITLHVNSSIVQQTADEASDTFQNLSLVSIRKLNAGDQLKVSMIHNLGAGVTTLAATTDFGHFSVTQLR